MNLNLFRPEKAYSIRSSDLLNICFALVIGSITSCSQPEKFSLCQESKSDSDDYALYIDSVNHYQMLVPKSWQRVQNFYDYDLALFDSTDFSTDSIARMFASESYVLPSNESFEEYMKKLNDETFIAIGDAGVGEYFTVDIQKTTWGRANIEYALTIDTRNPRITVKTYQFFVNIEQRIFVITLGTNDEDIESLLCRYVESITSVKAIN